MRVHTCDTADGYRVMEYWGNGDPMFGGSADDRALSVRGRFERACSERDRATFPTAQAAVAAAELAPKRAGGLVSVYPIGY